jgi:mannose-1-phosphate guanylyltransferase/mannose-6-phosphate isomerase
MNDSARIVYPVVLCGGAGARLWPASRQSLPKQFSRIVDDEVSTFQSTIIRLKDGASFGRITVIAAADSRFIVAEQLVEIGVEADIILEPEGRDSAAAVATAALHVGRNSPEALVLILAADHIVGDDEAFLKAVTAASIAAAAGYVMTLGVEPDHPSTNYGYICRGDAIPKNVGMFRVARFAEKPAKSAAEALIEEGALWNSGYFLFRADRVVGEFETYAPEVLAAAQEALEGATRDLDFIRLDAEAFKKAPKVSVDYAIMEKTKHAGVLPVSFPWSDVGTWDAVWQVLPKDGEGNALRGRVEVLNTRESLVHGDLGRITTVVGLDNVIVVSTPDAVLVASKAAAAQVKDLVGLLREKSYPEADDHLRIYRPWGWYQRIDIGARFQVKRIQVVPGGRLSLQKHYHRAEHWVVVHGTAEVTVDGEISLVHENEAIYLPIGSVHRLANPGKIPLELIEVQVGSYTGEDDIIRMEDIYNRQ